MKDYSKFITGFITNYEIKDNEILIHTPLTKKNEPIRRKYTKENVQRYEERLGNHILRKMYKDMKNVLEINIIC